MIRNGKSRIKDVTSHLDDGDGALWIRQGMEYVLVLPEYVQDFVADLVKLTTPKETR